MMRRSAGFHADEARRQLLKEWQNVPALELTANDYVTCRVNSVDLKNRLSDIETNCHDRLHVCLLRIVGASAAPTSMALPCRWRSRPQHQKRTHAPQQKHGRSRWNIFKQRAEPRCENSILHKKSVEKETVSIAGFLIYPSLWAIIVYGAVCIFARFGLKPIGHSFFWQGEAFS